jgi:hypothetical protein
MSVAVHVAPKVAIIASRSATAKAPRSARFQYPKAAMLLVNKLRGEVCSAQPLAPAPAPPPPPATKPVATGDGASDAAPAPPRPRRAFADRGTGRALFPRLASMGVLEQVASQLREAAPLPAEFTRKVPRRLEPPSPPLPGAGVKWTLAAGLDTASEGLVLVASHGWLAEYVRRHPRSTAALMGQAGSGEGRKGEKGQARLETPRPSSALLPSPAPTTVEGLEEALEGVLTLWVSNFDVRLRGTLRRHVLRGLAAGTYGPRCVMRGAALEDEVEEEAGRGRRHNSWYSASSATGSGRALRDALAHYGSPPSRLIRQSYGPWELGTIPEGGALHVPVHPALVRAAYAWAHPAPPAAMARAVGRTVARRDSGGTSGSADPPQPGAAPTG